MSTILPARSFIHRTVEKMEPRYSFHRVSNKLERHDVQSITPCNHARHSVYHTKYDKSACQRVRFYILCKSILYIFLFMRRKFIRRLYNINTNLSYINT